MVCVAKGNSQKYFGMPLWMQDQIRDAAKKLSKLMDHKVTHSSLGRNVWMDYLSKNTEEQIETYARGDKKIIERAIRQNRQESQSKSNSDLVRDVARAPEPQLSKKK